MHDDIVYFLPIRQDLLSSTRWVRRVAASGLSAYNKIAGDDAKLAQAESFKIFVDNSDWDNFIVSFKDLPGYATYSTALKSYKSVSLNLIKHHSFQAGDGSLSPSRYECIVTDSGSATPA